MPRNVEDIIPSKKRSIRDIPVPEDRRTRARRSADPEPGEVVVKIHKEKPTEEIKEDKQIVREYREEETSIPRMKAPLYRDTRRGPGNRWPKSAGWIAGGVVLVVIAFTIFSLFRSASLAYTPKSTPLNFQNESFLAYKTGGDGVLLFSVVKISDTKGVSVPATGETQVSKKASGTIVVYNNASTQPQKLIKNTRFQATDGHVYRAQQDIAIPGKSGSTPGSLDVVVVADQPGDAYNIGLTDFTVPGLKGDPRYSTIYARSKTPMTGGLVGTERGVSPEALAQAKTGLESSLKSKLIEEANAQVPADFVLFPSLATVSYEDMPQSSSTANMVTVNERGDFFGVIFKKSDLAEYIKEKKLALPASQTIEIDSLDTLTFNFSGTAPDDLLKATQISFTINGSTTAVWITNDESLKRDLAGTSKNDLTNVLKNYPGIASANALIRPFWKTSFPTTPSEITIKQNPLK